MATNGYDPNDQQGQNQGQQDSTMESQGENVSGSDATSAQGSPGAGRQGSQSASPAAGAALKPTSSGNFQNLTSYLNANKNYNASGGGLAGQVNQNLYNQGNQVNQNFQDAQNTYNQQVQAGTQQYDPNVVNSVLSNPYAYTQQQQNPNTLQQYNQMLNAQYQGPTQLDAGGTLQAQAQNYQNLTNQVGSENGRFNLLNQLYAAPGYSQGARSLDNLILQGNPNQLAQLQGARTMGNQLSGQLSQDKTQAANAAAQAQATTANTAAQTLGATNNAITGFDTQQAANVKDALANRDKQYNDVYGQLGNGSLDYNDAAKFGLLGAGGTAPNIYNLKLPSYLTEATNQATNQNVASTADYNKIQALGSLLGGKAVGNVSQILASYNDPSQAGQFAAASPYNFNTQQEQADAAAAQKAYTAAQTPYQQQIDAANAVLNSGENSEGKNTGLLGEQQDINSGLYHDVATGGAPGSPEWVAQQIAAQQQNQTNANEQLNQLLSQYGTNRKLNITGAPQMASITPSGTTPNVDTMSPALASIAGIGGINNI